MRCATVMAGHGRQAERGVHALFTTTCGPRTLLFLQAFQGELGANLSSPNACYMPALYIVLLTALRIRYEKYSYKGSSYAISVIFRCCISLGSLCDNVAPRPSCYRTTPCRLSICAGHHLHSQLEDAPCYADRQPTKHD